ncbi:ribonuclease H-like domain-containing protein [Tanacetum coccineum]
MLILIVQAKPSSLPAIARNQKSQSDSSSSFVFGSNVNTANFPVDNPGNDADSSDNFVATQNEDGKLVLGCLVDLPKGRKAIESKWIYKIKFRSSDEIDRYKARLIAQGFGQKKGIDYEETFSPVVKMVTVRYKKVCRLKKSLYGLKQAPKQWNAKLTSTLIENGFSQSKSDYSLYTKSDKGVFLALLVYVDDIIIIVRNIILSKSSTEAEYRALASVTSEVIWILKILKDLNIENLSPVSLHCDSNSAIKIAANPVFHERTKHLEIDLRFVIEFFLKGVVKTVKVESANQIADILTKGLDTIQHIELVKKLGMHDVYQVETKGRMLK